MSTIEVVEKKLGYGLEIYEKASMKDMVKILSKRYNQLMNYVMENTDEKMPMPYCRYVNVDWDNEMKTNIIKSVIDMLSKQWEFAVGVLCENEIIPDKGTALNDFPIAKYITTKHYGPYRKVTESYKKMIEFAKDNNLEVEDEGIEIYTNDPSKVKEKEIETILYIRCK